MAFIPDAGSGSTSGDTGVGIGASIGSMFGTDQQKSAAVDSARDFRDAAKAGGFRIDPEAARAALKDLDRAEDAARENSRRAEDVAQQLPIGGTDYAKFIAGKYREGGDSARRAVLADMKVIRLVREAVEAAVKNYQRMEGDNAQPFDRGL